MTAATALATLAPIPSVVVIAHVDSDRPRSCVGGDMIFTAYRRQGVVGVVTDGGVRDLAGLRQRTPDLQVFAPGIVVSHGTMTRIDMSVPVSVCGMTINPGDLLHGDQTGLVKVPVDIAEKSSRGRTRSGPRKRECSGSWRGRTYRLTDSKSTSPARGPESVVSWVGGHVAPVGRRSR